MLLCFLTRLIIIVDLIFYVLGLGLTCMGLHSQHGRMLDDDKVKVGG